MLYQNICGLFNLNLIKAALFIGCYDIFGTIMLIILEIEFFSQMQAQQLIYLSCFSIGILAAILLIQGAFQLNRFMLIYWLVVAVLRIILQTLLLLEIFIYNILESSSYELLYTLLELLDYVVLFTSFFLVWSLYKQLKHRDQNSFTRLQNEV